MVSTCNPSRKQEVPRGKLTTWNDCSSQCQVTRDPASINKMEDADEDWIFTSIHTCMCSCTHVCQHARKTPGIHIYMQNKLTLLFITVSLVLLEFLFKNYLFCFTCMVFYLHPYLCTMCVQCLWRSEEGIESCGTGVANNCDPPCIGKRTWVFRKNSQCSLHWWVIFAAQVWLSLTGVWAVLSLSFRLSCLAFLSCTMECQTWGPLDLTESFNHLWNCFTNKFSS